MLTTNKDQCGQTLIEIVVAIAVVAIVVTSFVTLGTVSVRNSVSSRNQVTATQLAQEGIEAMITIRDQNCCEPPSTDCAIRGIGGVCKWTDLGSGLSCPADFQSNCTYDFTLGSATLGNPPKQQHYIQTASAWGLPSPNNQFSRKIRITDGGTNIKTVSVYVWWTDSQGVHKSVLTRELAKEKL